MADKITQALEQLDPDVDGDWTEDGKPSVARVAELSGEANLKAEDIEDVAPNFTRAYAAGRAEDARVAAEAKAKAEADAKVKADEEAEAKATADEEAEATAADEEALAAAAGEGMAGVKPPEPVVEGPATAEEWDALIAGLEKDLEAARLDVHVAKLAETAASAAVDRARQARDAAFPPLSHAAMVQQYTQAQLKARAARRGGVRSPLDRAMSRPTGFGRRRPVFAGVGSDPTS